MVVVGYSRDESFTQFFTLARYDTSGNLDTAFGTGGVVTTSIGTSDGYANAVAIQDDGKIVVAGYAQGGSSDWVFTLARYDTSGNLDATFGIDGVVMTSVGADSDYGQDVAIQSDGKIVVAGWSWDSSNTVFSLARYTETGVLDAGFGVGGTVTQTVGTHAEGRAVAFQPDGKIVVAGYSYAGFGESNYDFTLLRYDDSGSLDGSFGSSGVVTTAFGNDADDRIYDIAIRENGAIVAVGANEPDYYLAVVQYTPDGAPLLGFGSVGRVNTDLGDHAAGAAVCLQPDGRIVVAGVGDDGPNTTFAVVRYGRDLAIHKTVTPPTAAPGEAITFTIAFSNTGALAPNVVIIDQMPLSVTVTGVVSAGVPITIVNAGPAVYAGAVGDLDYGQGGVITITGVVNTDSVADSFTNTVRINTNRWDSDPRNNSSAVTVSPLQVWLPLILKD
jgi:uncharacterized delta-60 repeat protein/uncharacterized repeat protein (TIGR01451 family)